MRICKKKPITKEDIWTEEEDKKLVDAYRFGGPFNWERVSEITGRDVFNCVKRFSILCQKRKDGRAILSTSYARPPTKLPTGVPSPSTILRFLSTGLPPPKNENLKRKLICFPPPVLPQKSSARSEVAWKWRKTCLPPPVLPPQKNYAREDVVWKWRKT